MSTIDDIHAWGNVRIGLGESKRVRLEVSESYTGLSVRLPMQVWRGKQDGPMVLITAAVHGDEINGTGTIREFVRQPEIELERGTLVMIPVINIYGFERHERYMPDRRDLNRSFPGSPSGSISARLAHLVFSRVISLCDYCIDLHTAAVRRTNYPNIRADMSVEGCARLADFFGCEVVIDGKGPEGSLRRCATDAGVPTIVFEAGEVWKVEPSYLATARRGILNCLRHLGMVGGEIDRPGEPVVVTQTKWVRADAGGFLQFHVQPGELVTEGQLLATNTGLLGRDQEQISAPVSGLIIGISTMPAVSPGDPVLQIAVPRKRGLRRMEAQINSHESDSIEERIKNDLATNLHVVEAEIDDEDDVR